MKFKRVERVAAAKKAVLNAADEYLRSSPEGKLFIAALHQGIHDLNDRNAYVRQDAKNYFRKRDIHAASVIGIDSDYLRDVLFRLELIDDKRVDLY